MLLLLCTLISNEGLLELNTNQTYDNVQKEESEKPDETISYVKRLKRVKLSN